MLLGQLVKYPTKYSPDILCAMQRSETRIGLGIDGDLPFHGEDSWNGWELTWLDTTGKPVIATVSIRVDAESPGIVESKSLKLYLGSLSTTRYGSASDVEQVISTDLENIVGAPVEIDIFPGADPTFGAVSSLPGTCVDDLPFQNVRDQVDASLLSATGKTVEDELHSHLLRSLCPITNQPDIGSVLLRYKGPRINPSTFLNYIVSFRQHHDFHEACVERIFLDIKRQCHPRQLTVHAFYNRRGGMDINPFRSDCETDPQELRLWRQ